jgi:hypothetical protein
MLTSRDRDMRALSKAGSMADPEAGSEALVVGARH